MTGNLLKTPAYFHREYENDFPTSSKSDPEVPSLASRTVKTALPFIALYQPFGKALAGGLGTMRVITTLGECFDAKDYQKLTWAMFNTCLAIGSVAGTIFLHPIGMLITTLSDIGMNAHHVYGAIQRGELFEAGKQTMRIANNSFYLAMLMTGSAQLQLASLAIQVLVEGSSSYEEFSNDHWLEAVGHLGMTAIRMNQSYQQFGILQKKWEAENLTQKKPTPKPVSSQSERTPLVRESLKKDQWHPLLASLEEQHGDSLRLDLEDHAPFPKFRSYGEDGNTVAVWINNDPEGTFFYISQYDAPTQTWSIPVTNENLQVPTYVYDASIRGSGQPSKFYEEHHWAITGIDMKGITTLLWNDDNQTKTASFFPSTNAWSNVLILGNYENPRMVFDSDSSGNCTIAWTEDGGYAKNFLNIASYDVNTQKWTEPIVFNPPLYQPEERDRFNNYRRNVPEDIEYDSEGNISIMATDRGEQNLFGIVYDSKLNEWSSPELVSSGFEDINELRIISPEPGKFLGMWLEKQDYKTFYDIWKSSMFDSNTKSWTTPNQITKTHNLLETEGVQLQLDPSGKVIGVWEETPTADLDGIRDLYHWFCENIDEVEDDREIEINRSNPIETFIAFLIREVGGEGFKPSSEDFDAYRDLILGELKVKKRSVIFDFVSNSWKVLE